MISSDCLNIILSFVNYDLKTLNSLLRTSKQFYTNVDNMIWFYTFFFNKKKTKKINHKGPISIDCFIDKKQGYIACNNLLQNPYILSVKANRIWDTKCIKYIMKCLYDLKISNMLGVKKEKIDEQLQKIKCGCDNHYEIILPNYNKNMNYKERFKKERLTMMKKIKYTKEDEEKLQKLKKCINELQRKKRLYILAKSIK